MGKRKIVTIGELSAELHAHGQYLKDNYTREELGAEKGDDAYGDVRLQLHEGSWSLHTGDSSYDQDHRGAWGVGSVKQGATWAECRDLARYLIDEAMSDYDDSQDDEA